MRRKDEEEVILVPCLAATVLVMDSKLLERLKETTAMDTTPSTSTSNVSGAENGGGGVEEVGAFPLLEYHVNLEEDEEERPPFYVGMRGADRKYSLCKQVRERAEVDKFLKNFNPGLTNKPNIRVDDHFVDSIREIAVGIPAYMRMWVLNTEYLNKQVTWEDFDLHFLSGVSRPKFTLRKINHDLFIVEVLAHLQGNCVFAVKCCGVTLKDSPFHIHAVNPRWSAMNSFAVVPSQTFCGDTVRVDITCKDQFGYLFPGASETLDIEMSGPAVIDKIKVKDNKDGSHVLFFKAIKIGRYKIAISAFHENIRGSPYEILVLPTKPDPNQTRMEGEGCRKAVAGCVHEFVMEPRDKYGNSRLVLQSGEVWNAVFEEVNSGEKVIVNMKPQKSGKKVLFKCDYRAFKSGKYQMTLSVIEDAGVVLSSVMPNHITVLPGITSGLKSVLNIATLHGYWTMSLDDKRKVWCIKAGSNLDISVQSCDKFGNKKYKEISQLKCTAEYVDNDERQKEKPELKIDVENNRNGTFSGKITGTTSGRYLCHVRLADEEVDYSPFYVSLTPAFLHVPSCCALDTMKNEIKGGITGLVGEENVIMVQGRDMYGNNLDVGGHDFCAILQYKPDATSTELASGKPISFMSKDNKDGTYSIRFKTNLSGDYSMSIVSFAKHIVHSPIPLCMKGQRDIASVLIDKKSNIRAVAGERARLRIIALDTFDNRQLSGGMTMYPEITIRPKGTRLINVNPLEKEKRRPLPTEVVDNNDGSYDIYYMSETIGEYNVVIKYADEKKITKDVGQEVKIKGGGLKIRIVPAEVHRASCIIAEASDQLFQSEAGTKSHFTIITADKYNNRLDHGGARIEAQAWKEYLPEGSDDILLDFKIVDNKDGSYFIYYTGRISGTYLSEISINGEKVESLSKKLTILPGLTDPSACVFEGDGIYEAQCGKVATFSIITKDKFGNIPDHVNEKFQVFLQPESKGTQGKGCDSNSTTRVRAKSIYSGNGVYSIEYVPRKASVHQLFVFYNPIKKRPGWSLVRQSFITDEWSSSLIFKSTVDISAGIAVASNTSAKGNSLGGTLAGRPGVVSVNVRDRFGHPQVPTEEQNLCADLVDEDGNSVGTTTISHREGTVNEFIVIYRSHIEGDHQLHITLDRKHIVRSPFRVTVYSNDINTEELRVHNKDLIWDSDIALMWEQKHNVIDVDAIPAGSAKAAAGYLQSSGRTQVVSLGESITLAKMENELRYGHYITRKKAMSLHSRIASLTQFYTPNLRIRRATPATNNTDDGKS